MQIKILTITMLSMFLLSCNSTSTGPEEKVHIVQQGTISDAIDKSPINNAKIELWKDTRGSFLGEPITGTITLELEVFSDNVGYYFIDYKGEDNCIHYYLEIHAEGYNSKTNGEVKCTGQLVIINFELWPQ